MVNPRRTAWTTGVVPQALRLWDAVAGFWAEGNRIAGAAAGRARRRRGQPIRSARTRSFPPVRTRRPCARRAHTADAADQAVAVRGQPVDGGPHVVDLEGHVAQPQLGGHGGLRAGLV